MQNEQMKIQADSKKLARFLSELLRQRKGIATE